MTQVTIKKAFTKDIETKRGPRLSVGLKIEESSIKDIDGLDVAVNDRWINGFFDPGFTLPFKEGDKVDLLVKTQGEYLNFSIPGVGKAPAPDFAKLVERIQRLEDTVFGDQAASKEPENEPVSEPDF